jgi:hypothetical protein
MMLMTRRKRLFGFCNLKTRSDTIMYIIVNEAMADMDPVTAVKEITLIERIGGFVNSSAMMVDCRNNMLKVIGG